MNEEQLIDASEATRYLAQKWGIPSYSMDAFKQLRLRHHIKPALSSKTATFWRKSDLDQIPKPDRSRPRGKRVKKNGVATAHDTSMMLMEFGLAQPLEGSSLNALIA
jgi:hypothetical protein